MSFAELIDYAVCYRCTATTRYLESNAKPDILHHGCGEEAVHVANDKDDENDDEEEARRGSAKVCGFLSTFLFFRLSASFRSLPIQLGQITTRRSRMAICEALRIG